MKRSWLALSLAVLLCAALLASALCKFNWAEQTRHYKTMLKHHQRLDAQVRPGAVLFFGDSLVQGLDVSAISPMGVNFGIGTDTTDGLLKRLDNYSSLKRSSAIVIHTGIVDLKWRDLDETMNNFGAIMDKLPKGLKVIISGLFPVNESKGGRGGYNAKVAELNARLAAICKERQCMFIDAGAGINSEMLEDDGLHLNSKGYALWARELRNALTK